MHPRLTVYPRFTTNRQEDTDPGTTRTVHPRACGEQNEERPPFDSFVGSSPRVRGTDLQLAFAVATYRFIPARAGNRAEFHSVRDASDGFIPARAGNRAEFHSVRERADRFIPARAGNSSPKRWSSSRQTGSSPRVRGTASPDARSDGTGRFIPARAGNSQMRRSYRGSSPVHPRACGEQCRLRRVLQV